MSKKSPLTAGGARHGRQGADAGDDAGIEESGVDVRVGEIDA
jgi:hypothetical protein